MDIREISYGSSDYEQEKRLRHEVLRVPLGMVLTDSDIAGEDTQLHFAAFADGEMVGCVLFKLLSDHEAKLRQMAVATHRHGQGVGQQFVSYAEEKLRQHGIRHITTDARTVAQSFYTRLGYAVEGEPYEVLGIPSICMVKTL